MSRWVISFSAAMLSWSVSHFVDQRLLNRALKPRWKMSQLEPSCIASRHKIVTICAAKHMLPIIETPPPGPNPCELWIVQPSPGLEKKSVFNESNFGRSLQGTSRLLLCCTLLQGVRLYVTNHLKGVGGLKLTKLLRENCTLTFQGCPIFCFPEECNTYSRHEGSVLLWLQAPLYWEQCWPISSTIWSVGKTAKMWAALCHSWIKCRTLPDTNMNQLLYIRILCWLQLLNKSLIPRNGTIASSDCSTFKQYFFRNVFAR